jgi:hypothetical protein
VGVEPRAFDDLHCLVWFGSMPTKSKIQGDRESRLMRVARTWGPWKSPPSVIWIRKIKEAATLHERDLSMLLVRDTRLIAPCPMEALLSCIGVHHKVNIPLGSGAAPLTKHRIPPRRPRGPFSLIHCQHGPVGPLRGLPLCRIEVTAAFRLLQSLPCCLASSLPSL